MNKKKKSIFQQATAKVAKLLKLSFATIVADDGTTLYIDGDAVEGATVYVLTETGDYQVAADGTYNSEGRVYVISGGVITSISNGDAENFEVDVPEPEEATGTTVSVDEYNDLVEIVADLLDVVREQDVDIEAHHEAIMDLEAELRKARKESNAAPADNGRKLAKKDKKIDFADQKMKNLVANFK